MIPHPGYAPAPAVDDPDFRLLHGDALDWMAVLPPCSVDAIVTSPPYADLRDYGGAPPDEYADWFTPFLVAMLRLVKPTGSLLLNLGRIHRNGEEHPYVDDTGRRARELGWRRIDTLIWHKLNAQPHTAPQYLHNKHEHVLWLAPSTRAYRGYDKDTRHPHSQATIERRGRGGLRGPKNRSRNGYQPQTRTPLNPDGAKPGSVYACNIGREKGLKHDAPMALEFAEHLVCLACPAAGLVLDPFAGACTTALAARRKGRECICIELDPAAVAEAVARFPQQALALS